MRTEIRNIKQNQKCSKCRIRNVFYGFVCYGRYFGKEPHTHVRVIEKY